MAKTTKTTPSKKAKTKGEAPNYKKRIIWVIMILFAFNLFTGAISYGAMTVWCMRPPITANDFAASYHYFRPGEVHYGPNPFAKYYCSEQDARNAGFNPGNY